MSTLQITIPEHIVERLNRIKVPDNTIRKTWDAYADNGTNLSEKYNINLIGDMDKDKHTTKKCHKESARGLISKFRRRRGRKRRGKNIKEVCENVGTFSVGKVPIGAWAEIYSGNCYSGDPLFTLKYTNETNGQLTDDLATKCSGGSQLGYDKYLDKDCILLNDPNIDFKGKDNCFVSGVQTDVFCQLGDYIATNQTCVDACANTKSTNDPNYCTFAMDRLCSKKVGDPLKNDAFGKLLNSEKNWIRTDLCSNYCGGPEEQDHKCVKTRKQAIAKIPIHTPAPRITADLYGRSIQTSPIWNPHAEKNLPIPIVVKI